LILSAMQAVAKWTQRSDRRRRAQAGWIFPDLSRPPGADHGRVWSL